MHNMRGFLPFLFHYLMPLQMKFYFLLFILWTGIILSGCKPGAAPVAGSEQDTSAANKEYYPVTGYIQSQLRWLDSVPLAVIKYTTVNHHTDTSILEKKDFNAIAEALFSPDISVLPLKEQYDEVSFIDASLGTISLTYAARNDTALVRKADVLLNQSNSAVSTIYVEKISRIADRTLTQKILWTANKSCLVTTITQKTGTPEKVTEERYAWDDR
jgi:hypothetical protein